jgi:hypothetical protein
MRFSPTAIALGSLLAACGGRAPAHVQAATKPGDPGSVGVTASNKATLKLNPAWGRCHANVAITTEEPGAVAAKVAAGCGDVTKMHRAFGPFAGNQAAANAPQSYKWKAQAGHCYRAYGAGAGSIKNVDLLIKDSAGIVLGQSDADDNAPVALREGAVCFKVDDDASVVVSVGDGTGAYAVEVWSD